jgi:hypothetical protein
MRKAPSSARSAESGSPGSPRIALSAHRVAPARVAPNSASNPKNGSSPRHAGSSQESAARKPNTGPPPDAFSSARAQLLSAAVAGAEQKQKSPAGAVSAWEGEVDPEPAKTSLSARLGLAAGISKGFKGIGALAAAAKSPRGRQMLTRSPLDLAIADALRAREDSRRAMSEGELNLGKM